MPGMPGAWRGGRSDMLEPLRDMDERRDERYNSGYDDAYAIVEERELQREYDAGKADGMRDAEEDYPPWSPAASPSSPSSPSASNAFDDGDCAKPAAAERRWPTHV